MEFERGLEVLVEGAVRLRKFDGQKEMGALTGSANDLDRRAPDTPSKDRVEGPGGARPAGRTDRAIGRR